MRQSLKDNTGCCCSYGELISVQKVFDCTTYSREFSCQLFTVEAQVQSHYSLCRFKGGQSESGAGFPLSTSVVRRVCKVVKSDR